MRKIAWQASFFANSWLRLWSFRGELRVHVAASDTFIHKKVIAAVIKSLKIEWKEL